MNLRSSFLILLIGVFQSIGFSCWKILTDGYQILTLFSELQFNNLPLPNGSNKNVFLPNAPAICAFKLLQVIIKSHALTIEATLKISLK